jgi:hypothetical protein
MPPRSPNSILRACNARESLAIKLDTFSWFDHLLPMPQLVCSQHTKQTKSSIDSPCSTRMTRLHPIRAFVPMEVVVSGWCSTLGVDPLFFNPNRNCLTVHTKSSFYASKTRTFLAGFDDDVFFFLAVGVGAGVFTVLFVAGFAFVALSAVWCESEFDEGIALAEWASEGNCNGHEIILHPTTTHLQVLNLAILE